MTFQFAIKMDTWSAAKLYAKTNLQWLLFKSVACYNIHFCTLCLPQYFFYWWLGWGKYLSGLQMTKMNEIANTLENGNKICMMRMNQISIFPIPLTLPTQKKKRVWNCFISLFTRSLFRIMSKMGLILNGICLLLGFPHLQSKLNQEA